MAQETADTKKYVSILAEDGTFRFPVAEGTEGSVERKWSVGENSGVKNELVWKSMSGKITKVDIISATFGELLQVTITDEDSEYTISIPQGNSFAIDLMKKMPAVDFSKDVKLSPYSFTNDAGKSIKGVTVMQDEVKVNNFFYDAEANTELHDFPTPTGDTTKFTSNKWKSYFGEVEDFLVEYTKKHLSTVEDPLAEDGEL